MEFIAALILFLVLTTLGVAFRKKRVDSATLQDWANIFTVSSVISVVIVGTLAGIGYLIKVVPSDVIRPSPQIIITPTITPQKPTETSIPSNTSTGTPIATLTPVLTSTSIQIIEVPSDIPGASIQPSMSITSLLDVETKKRDVYSIQLHAGQTVYLTANANKAIALYYAKPEFETFELSDGVQLTGAGGELQSSFIAAISGTYYIMVKPFDNGIKYELSVNVDTPSISQVTDDVPGTSIDSGAVITSVVDIETKKRDVYSIKLNAGQTVYLTAKANKGVALYYAKPGFDSFVASDGVQLTGAGGDLTTSFVSATSGIYHIMVKAFDNGIKYELSVRVDNSSISQVLDDVPGTRIESGIVSSSVLDQETKKRDVYSILLNAGQTVYLIAKSNKAIALYYGKPGFATFLASDGVQLTGAGGELNTSFVAATSGTYYIMIKAFDNGIKYELQVIVR